MDRSSVGSNSGENDASEHQQVIKTNVQEYYGKMLKGSDDLQTNACCTSVDIPKKIKKIMGYIHGEVMSRYYGCGLTIPTALEGLTVLDLGSGSGRDCYILSSLVGELGKVVGVDMTDEQLEVANKYRDYHRDKFGHKESNVTFLKGDIENLEALDFPDNSFDLIISNCVINLAADKKGVLSEVYRILRPGGEMYFSDVYSDRRVPQKLQEDKVLWGECLSGALYWNDFYTFAKDVGFQDPRMIESHPITIENTELERKINWIKFFSATFRLFKIEEMEGDCEDFGQAVIYNGTLPESPHCFVLDDHHVMPKGSVFKVCGNTYLMLKKSRFSKYFSFVGDCSTHYGIFEGCGKRLPFSREQEVRSISQDNSGGCCS